MGRRSGHGLRRAGRSSARCAPCLRSPERRVQSRCAHAVPRVWRRARSERLATERARRARPVESPTLEALTRNLARRGRGPTRPRCRARQGSPVETPGRSPDMLDSGGEQIGIRQELHSIGSGQCPRGQRPMDPSRVACSGWRHEKAAYAQHDSPGAPPGVLTPCGERGVVPKGGVGTTPPGCAAPTGSTHPCRDLSWGKRARQGACTQSSANTPVFSNGTFPTPGP